MNAFYFAFEMSILVLFTIQWETLDLCEKSKKRMGLIKDYF